MNVFGVRNIPYEYNPAQQASTVKMCESGQHDPGNKTWQSMLVPPGS